jgi:hypothetical protein
MGILANGYRDNLGCFKTFGATASNNAYPSSHHANLHRAARTRNITAGQGITSELVSIPSGNRHPSAWMMPQQAGALAARNTLDGSGDIAADILSVKLALADLTGSGALSAVGSLIVQALADITGTGEISDAALQAFLAAVADLTGSGEVSDADLEGLGAVLASLTGSGTATGSVLTAIGELEAALTVTGTGLSTANVGQAVWAHLIEAGFTAAEVLQIIAAVTAGKASGGPDSPVFRNLGDTSDIVSGEADSSGNRTSVTYTPD